jgi:hypothetical protein
MGNFFIKTEPNVFEELSIPLDIENIIYDYKKQLDFSEVIGELKQKVKYRISVFGDSVLTFPDGRVRCYEWCNNSLDCDCCYNEHKLVVKTDEGEFICGLEEKDFD